LKESDRVVTSKGKYDDTIFRDFSHKQVEKRYGGDLENIDQFW